MVTLIKHMDDHSLTMERNGKHIGFLQWHSEHSPHIDLWSDSGVSSLSIEETKQILHRWEEIKANEFKA